MADESSRSLHLACPAPPTLRHSDTPTNHSSTRHVGQGHQVSGTKPYHRYTIHCCLKIEQLAAMPGETKDSTLKNINSICLDVWKYIFDMLRPCAYERLHLRRLCRLFKDSLQPPPSGCYTEFPHQNHTSVNSLINRLNDLLFTPTILFLKEGHHQVINSHQWAATVAPRLLFTYPIKVIGSGRDKTFLYGGGIRIIGPKEDAGTNKVELSGMTIRDTAGATGLCADSGLSFSCDSMTFIRCGGDGVYASNTNGTLINCIVTQCGECGITCNSNALVKLEGSQTKVEGNVQDGDTEDYGLTTYGNSSRIHLLSPLTKESVSTNNPTNRASKRDYGGKGTIRTVDEFLG